ncbi:hypothetical protein JXO52_04630 [bacterium]|nr:hypothetical protein [bacterium]
MNPLLYVIAVPFILGVLCFIPGKVRYIREAITFLGTAFGFTLSLLIFLDMPMEWSRFGSVLLKVDHLSGFTLLAAGFFTLFIALYSFRYMKDTLYPARYYGCILWTFAATAGALMANHLLLLLVFWGFLGITLYLLVLTGGDAAAPAARKSLAVIGGTDALMLLGIILIYQLSSTFQIDGISLHFNSLAAYTAFFTLLLGAFAKAGVMPMHTWIPDVSEHAPIPVTAFLPASLDKLLGIYLMIRMCFGMFAMNASVNLVLLIVGSITILASVSMALMQNDFRRLLAYCAISQVGYMVLGIGTGLALGLMAALFHMINHMLYKTCLFFTAGSVKQQTGSNSFADLGGLGRLMPWTFVSFLIAAFAVSGIPPLNGFVSKWMIYQSLLKLKDTGGSLWVIWLFAAMFGSGLTLASFMKLTHAVFLGTSPVKIVKAKIGESGFLIIFPMAFIAVLCVLFGIFAFSGPITLFLQPITAMLKPTISGVLPMPLYWSAGTATLLILAGLIIGFLIYLAGNLKNVREADSFTGGEELPVDTRVSGIGFYDTVRDLPVLGTLFKRAEAKWFDLYELGSNFAYSVGGLLKKAHTGLLNLYLLYILLGLIIFLILLMGR